MKNYIITISREYGSGGRDVGKILADDLGLPYFDKEILHLAAEKSGMGLDFIEKSEERVPSKLLLNLHRLSLLAPISRVPSGFNSYAALSPAHASHDSEKLYHLQSSVIKEIAESGGCVIVGRCASHVLRDYPNLLSVFIRSHPEDRVQRAIETYDRPQKNAANDLRRIDKHRANHYELFTGRKWGAVDNYDLVVNTSYTGIHGAVDVIKTMVATQSNNENLQ